MAIYLEACDMAKEFKQYEEHFDVLVMHLRLGDQLYSILHVDKSDNLFSMKNRQDYVISESR